MGRAKAKNGRVFPMTKEPKWTKGPWRYEHHPNNEAEHRIYSGEDYVSEASYAKSIYAGGGGYLHKDGVARANAHLIAAAPELYEALDLLLFAYRRGRGIEDDIIQEAKAALSKALGETG